MNRPVDCTEPLLAVEDLAVRFPLARSLSGRVTRWLQAVAGISFRVNRGQIVGLVGESGSGKSTVGRSLVRLAPVHRGRIAFDGTELTSLSTGDFFPMRKRMQMIFQDPQLSLNPRRSVREIVGEGLQIHFPDWDEDRRRRRVVELLDRVGLGKEHLDRRPEAFSGGQKQRIGIARALAVEPDFLICDEPVSALDVSVQASIVNLLADLRRDLGLSLLFIAHDLAVVEHISDWVMVMEAGVIVEQAPAADIYRNPQHPFTRRLLEAAPRL